MSKSFVYHCDFCGAQKRETNHWWDIFIESEGKPVHLEIHPFDPNAEDNHMMACGEKCVGIGVSRFLSNGSLTNA